MEQLIYISNQLQPYIKFAIVFLSNRVREPDVEDYKKRTRVMNYTQGTIGLPLILSMDKSVNIKWYIDAEFVVHKYIRSHTGGFMTMVTEGAYIQSVI